MKQPETLEEAFDFYEPAIRRASLMRHDRLPGMERDDIRQEMRVCLVKAWQWMQRRSDDVNFNRLFWTLWNRRKIDAVRQARARVETVPLPVDVDEAMDLFGSEDEPLYEVAEILADLDPEAMTVALMRAEGWRANEVMHELGMSRRQYYRVWDRVMGAAT